MVLVQLANRAAPVVQLVLEGEHQAVQEGAETKNEFYLNNFKLIKSSCELLCFMLKFSKH